METNTYYPIAEMALEEQPGVYASFSTDGGEILVSNGQIEKTTDWIASCGPGTPQQFETQALPQQQYFSAGSSWLVMEQTNATGEEVPKITLRELESGKFQEIHAGLQTSSAWFHMPEAPAAPASAPSNELSTLMSPAPTSANSPVGDVRVKVVIK